MSLVHCVGFPVILFIVGAWLSILFILITDDVATFPTASLTFIIIPCVFFVYVFVFSFCHVCPLSKLYASVASPDKLSSAFIVNVTLSLVHFSFPVTFFIVGAWLSIFFILITDDVATFPTASLTFIIIPCVFFVYVFVFSFCHVCPLSKLYASVASPDKLSSAFTINITLSLVHFSFPVTFFIVGTESSITYLILFSFAYCSAYELLLHNTDKLSHL